MKKKLFVCIMLFALLFSQTNKAKAVNVTGVSDDYSYSCYLSVGGAKSVQFSLDGIIRDGDVMYLSIKGKPALCINFNLKLGISYEIISVLFARDPVSGSDNSSMYAPLYKIYNYVASDPANNYENGQIALWVLLHEDNANWSARFRKKYNSFAELKAAFPDFANSFTRGKSCSNITAKEKIKNGLDTSNYPKEIFSKIYADYYDCDIFQKTKEEYLSTHNIDSKSPLAALYSSYYDSVIKKYGTNNDTYLKVGTSGRDELNDNNQKEILQIYNDIVSSSSNVPGNPNGALAVWCPKDDDNNYDGKSFSKVAGGQCVIAPLEISCATCNSALEKYIEENSKDNTGKYNINDLKELKKRFPELNIDDPAKPYCQNNNDECVKYVKVVNKYPKKFNSSILKKYASRVSKYGYKVSYTKETIACGGDYCHTLIDDLNAGKITLDEFNKKRLDSNTVPVKLLSDGKYYCDDEEFTCQGLLDTGNYDGEQPISKFNEFVAKITSPEEKAKAVYNSNKTISCNNCEPDVDTSKAICDVEGKQPSYFTLKDATEADGSPKQACYQYGIAYNLELDKVGSLDEDFSKSDYCNVYCWESVTVNLPTSPSAWGAVRAGEVFYWGIEPLNNIFARLETKRICWTKPDYNLFANDWNTNESAISQAYADYMAQTLYNGQTAADIKSNNDNCCMGTESTVTDTVASTGDGAATAQAYGYNSCSCKEDGKTAEGYKKYTCECTKTTCSGGRGNTYKLDSKSYTIPGTGITGTSTSKTSSCLSQAPDISELKDTGEESKRKKNLTDLVNRRNTLRKAILSCQSTDLINKKTIYDYSKASMSFSPDTSTNLNLTAYGVQNTKLVGSIEDDYTSITTSESTVAPKLFNCSGYNGGIKGASDICEGQTYITIPNFENGFTWDYTGSYVFKYTSEFFFVAKKTNSEITNLEENNPEKPSDYEKNKNLYYIEGYGLPVSFKKSTGYYFVKVVMSGLGNAGHFDKIFEQTDAEEKYGYNFKDGYSCPYFIHNPIYQHECNYECDPNTLTCKKLYNSPADCDSPNGLDIVYRVIDLADGDVKKIFPSIDGDGRDPASNWADFIANRNTTFKNITSYKTIYDDTPMYSIELTPSAIGKIRKSNASYRADGKDPYTSYKDTKDEYKITCDDKTDDSKTCVSSYVTELIKSKIVKGKYAIESEGQRLTALSNYKSCYDVSNPTNC